MYLLFKRLHLRSLCLLQLQDGLLIRHEMSRKSLNLHQLELNISEEHHRKHLRVQSSRDGVMRHGLHEPISPVLGYCPIAVRALIHGGASELSLLRIPIIDEV